MDGHEVRLSKHLVELQFFTRNLELLVPHEGIAIQDAHPERGRARRYRTSDVAKAHEPQRAPGEPKHRFARRHLPASTPHEPIVERGLARTREDEGHRVLGYLVDAVRGVVSDDDPGFGCRLEVDGVHTDAVTGDDLAPLHPRHDLGADGPCVRIE